MGKQRNIFLSGGMPTCKFASNSEKREAVNRTYYAACLDTNNSVISLKFSLEMRIQRKVMS